MNDNERRENLLGALALAVADRLREQTEQVVGHGGSSPAALAMIAQFPDRSVEFLRQAVGLSQPATVRLVDRLVEDGLVTRRSAGRGPAVSLKVTAAGRRKARRLVELRQKVLADSLPELSKAESAALTAVLERALAHLAGTPGTTICRLCDLGGCRNRDCPVVRRQVEIGAPPPDPVPLRPRDA